MLSSVTCVVEINQLIFLAEDWKSFLLSRETLTMDAGIVILLLGSSYSI